MLIRTWCSPVSVILFTPKSTRTSLSSLWRPIPNLLHHRCHLFRTDSYSTTTTRQAHDNIMSSARNNNMENDDIVLRKKQLRQLVRAKLKQIDKETIHYQSQQVWHKLVALPQYQNAKSIGLFLSMPKGEIDTDFILKHAMNHQKIIYVPEVGKNFELAEMELVQVIVDSTNNQDEKKEIFHTTWPRNKWGIPEPPPSMPLITAKPGDIDLLVVPGLAFDRDGNRCGQGKGYYDRFIERMFDNGGNSHKKPYLVAVGLQAQLVDETIPMAEYDRRMDMVLLPDETILVQQPSS